jgi:hypothetical protein
MRDDENDEVSASVARSWQRTEWQKSPKSSSTAASCQRPTRGAPPPSWPQLLRPHTNSWPSDDTSNYGKEKKIILRERGAQLDIDMNGLFASESIRSNDPSSLSFGVEMFETFKNLADFLGFFFLPHFSERKKKNVFRPIREKN